MWELMKNFAAGFLIVTWVLIILTGVNSFDMYVVHNKDFWFIPVSVLTVAFAALYFHARKKP